MIELRKEFQKQQESKFSGTELLFETSNEKYINWLEQKVVKNLSLGNVSNRTCTDCKSLVIRIGKNTNEHNRYFCKKNKLNVTTIYKYISCNKFDKDCC